MSFLILVRHGQSTWNLEKKFTGWVDVDLTEKGILEAKKAGSLLKNKNIKIDFYYTSLQLRANNTLKIIQQELDDKKNFTRAWQLNERHYGSLTGLNKIEMSKKIGEDKIYEFRRSWDLRPDPLKKESPYHPLNIDTYKLIPRKLLPSTESLKDTYERVVNFFGNSIRALCKNLFNLDNKQISNLEIPTGNPMLIEFRENFAIAKCEYLDKERAKDLLVF